MTTMLVSIKQDVAMGHRLHGLPPGHKCGRVHGHGIEVEVVLACKALDTNMHWVEDFGVLKKVIAPVFDALDHRCLLHPDDPLLTLYASEVSASQDGFEAFPRGNPTSENIGLWVVDEVGRLLIPLNTTANDDEAIRVHAVTIRESPRSAVTVTR